MENSINVLVMGRVPIVCSAISDTISRNFKESFVMLTHHPNEVIALNEIVSFNLILIDSDDYSKLELHFLNEIKKVSQQTKIIIFSFDEDTAFTNWCFKNGANAFLSKYSSEEKMVKTIHLALNGNQHFINELKIKVTSPNYKKQQKPLEVDLKILSSREFEIVHLLTKGYKNKCISDQLCISESTVSTYKKRILLKTGTHNIFELLNKMQNT